MFTLDQMHITKQDWTKRVTKEFTKPVFFSTKEYKEKQTVIELKQRRIWPCWLCKCKCIYEYEKHSPWETIVGTLMF